MYSETLHPKTIDTAFECAATLLGGLEEMAELNLQSVNTSLAEQHVLAQAAVDAKSIDQLCELQFRQLPAAVSKSFSYWQHVGDITVRAQCGLFSVVQELFEASFRQFADAAAIVAGVPATAQPGASAQLVIVDEPEVDAVGPVAILDSSGKLVSFDAARAALH
ncbi:phasin family protein [Paraburkholderia sp. MMS20-SJTR3]|uniref:Phasin family protein n=1 Tax=Paraburkholderia sejongensis TaxID=2886946 RepID=A0ABS8K5U0_9BURK|nr:phasin family protein [Paraburkholderia sp. MMS20-SJTR3]MCC8397458.1 phasin family protein [Paraburkholderia sp. MMS20-SJTR3]